MRNVVFAINISIDGCCDHTFAAPDDELMNFFTGLIQEAGVLLYGRISYELMVPYWPEVAKDQSGTKEENKFAEALTGKPKVVFSRTLQHAESDTQIMRGNLEEEVRKLKRQPGGPISVGGVDLPSQLMALGLINEFHFVVHPVIVGKGRRLDIDLPQKLNLKLVGSRTFASGAMAHHYLKA